MVVGVGVRAASAPTPVKAATPVVARKPARQAAATPDAGPAASAKRKTARKAARKG